jgi:hypothetical protein
MNNKERDRDLDDFHQMIKKITYSDTYQVSDMFKTVCLFRVAVEHGVDKLGFPMLTFLMARLLTVTLGIAAGSESSTYEDILDSLDEEDQFKH